MSYTDERHEQEARDREVREKIGRLRAQQEARDREVREKIGRLRARIETVGAYDPKAREVLNILKGILDLLGDEL